jgi:hypothetical protein
MRPIVNDRTKIGQCNMRRLGLHGPPTKCAVNGRTRVLTTGSFRSSGRTIIRDRPKATLYSINENVVKRNIVRNSFGRVLGAKGYGGLSTTIQEGRKTRTSEFGDLVEDLVHLNTKRSNMMFRSTKLAAIHNWAKIR